MGKGKKRTSRSFHISIQHLSDMLYDSLHKCGEIGANSILILGKYACRVMSAEKYFMFYLKTLQVASQLNYLDVHTINRGKKGQNVPLSHLKDL